MPNRPKKIVFEQERKNPRDTANTRHSYQVARGYIPLKRRSNLAQLARLRIERVVVVVVSDIDQASAQAIRRKDEEQSFHRVVDELEIFFEREHLEQEARLDARYAGEKINNN